MADNNRVIVELGTVIKNRGEWDSLAQNAKLYKDNVVQYNGSAYIVKSAPASGIGKDILPTNTAYYEVFAGVGEVATGSDFDAPSAAQRGKITTVGAVLDGMNDGVYNLTAKTGDSYATLNDALIAANNTIPTNKKRGGMSICFVNSTDHKYVQYMYKGTATTGTPNPFLNTDNWEKVNLENEVKQLISRETIIPGEPITSSYPNDLDFSDENNNLIVEFKDGHVRTKNFDSSKDATTSERGLMSSSDKTNLESNNTKLATIEEGAEVNDTEVTNSISVEDLNISDENGYMIAMLKNGHIKTKNFDSSGIERENLSDNLQNELQKLKDNGLVAADFDITDENDDVILSVLNGYPKTKNFNGKEIFDKTKVTEWSEKWSRMPSLEDNPLAKVRFDGGMCRIFRKWGFVGDSLCSGTMNGYAVTELSYTEIQNKAISNGSIVDDNTSIVSDNITLDGRYPAIKMVFQSNSELNGKVLLASYTNGTYTPLITGGTTKEYQNIVIPNDSVIAVSYPSSNVPRILLSVDGTQQANYEMSWGQQLVRLLGAEGYNFSIGGEYAKRWCVGGAGGSSNRNWEKAQQTDELKDVYVIGLGVNDRAYWFAGQTSIVNYPCVTAYPNVSDYAQTLVLSDNDVMDDIDLSDYTQNANSYAGWYSGIIQRIKSVRKDAYIFCCTLPDSYTSMDKSNAYSQVVRKIVNKLNDYYGGNTIWLLDLETYNPITSEIKEKIYNSSHLTAFGYLYYAYQLTSYIDWIIRNNVAYFKNVPFIGTTTVAERFDDFKVQ